MKPNMLSMETTKQHIQPPHPLSHYHTANGDRVTLSHNKHDYTNIFEKENGKLLCKTLSSNLSEFVEVQSCTFYIITMTLLVQTSTHTPSLAHYFISPNL